MGFSTAISKRLYTFVNFGQDSRFLQPEPDPDKRFMGGRFGGHLPSQVAWFPSCPGWRWQWCVYEKCIDPLHRKRTNQYFLRPLLHKMSSR
eukprot:6831480-Pyramimonas_sp.AAC.2